MIFQSVQLLTYSLDGVVTSKLWTCNWIFEVNFVNWIPYSICAFSKLKNFPHSQVLKEFVYFEKVAREEGFDEQAFTEGLLALPLDNNVIGVLRTLNDNIADKVTPEEVKTLYGRDYYMEEILGLQFKVSAFSFFQTSVEAVERLYREALALIDDFDGKMAFDLYCGTGTIGQIMAEAGSKKVVGIELIEEAVVAANENAKRNGLENCTFIAGDVLKMVDELEDKPDLIIVDPPRDGIHPKAIGKIIDFGAPEIVYVSCKPTSLARDLEIFQQEGYKVEKVKLMDMFPRTVHVETVALLKKV